MKTVIKIFVVMFILNIASVVCPNKALAQGPVSYQVFYDELSPYGEWVSHPNYGYVWIPYAGPNFAPYQTAGHWAYTNYGWTWVSDYQWGWAPFHYGRWDRDAYFGWIWVPGHQWGPAWVSWRRCQGYYGWAPIAPGISIEYAYGYEYYPPQDRWVFVDERYIDDRYVDRYYAPRGENYRYIERGTVIQNRHDERGRGYFYNEGPRREEVERGTHRNVERMEVRDHDRPGQNTERNTISMYRPEVNRGNERNANVQAPAPRRVTERNAVKPERERPDANLNHREADKPAIKRDEPNQQPVQKPKVEERQNQNTNHNTNAPANNNQIQNREPEKKPVESKPAPDNRNQQQVNPNTPRVETPKPTEMQQGKPNTERSNQQTQPANGNQQSGGSFGNKPAVKPTKTGKEVKPIDKKDTKAKTPEVKEKDKAKPAEEPVKDGGRR